MTRAIFLSLLALAASTGVYAKIGYEDCTSTMTTHSLGYDYYLYYLSDTGEVCENADCGGGRAPPKFDVPWCAAYTGTETYSQRFIDLPTPTPEPTPSNSAPVETTTVDAPATTFVTSEAETSASSSAVTSTAVTSSDVTSAPTTQAPSTDTSVPSGTGFWSISAPGTSATTSAYVYPPDQTGSGAVAGMRVSGGMMAGFVAVAGILAM